MIFGPDERRCTCDGCWACGGYEVGCTCDVDWDALAEQRAPIDWGAAPEDVDPNEDGIGYQ